MRLGSLASLFVIFAVAAAVSMVNVPRAEATDFPAVGGQGDAAARDVCPPGSYLTGANARTGAWIDQISILCSAPINPNGTIGYGPPAPGPNRGGNGGGSSNNHCGANEIIFGMGLLHTEGNRQVRLISFNCVQINSTARHNLEIGPQVPLFPTTAQNCPAGEAAVGVSVRYGQHVNALGLLICDRFVIPAAPGTASSTSAREFPAKNCQSATLTTWCGRSIVCHS